MYPNAAQLMRFKAVLDVRDFGAVGNGIADDTAAIQAALDSLASAGGGIVRVPSGVYSVTSGLLLGSGCRLYGDGPSSIIRAATQDNILNNASPANGNADIAVADLVIDMTASNGPGQKGIWLQNVQRCRVTRVKTIYGAEGVALTQASDCLITHNVIMYNGENGIDSWWDIVRCLFLGNHVIGSARPGSNGIVVTGQTTAGAPATSQHNVIASNTVYNQDSQGIWLQGGNLNGTPGTVAFCVVQGNVIDTVASYHGIRASEGYGHVIVGNVFRGVTGRAITLNGEGAAGGGHDCVIADNRTDPNGLGATDIPIWLDDGAVHNLIRGNRITGGAVYNYGIYCNTGAVNNLVEGNVIDRGADDFCFDNGGGTPTGNRFVGNPGYNPRGGQAAPAVPASGVALVNPFPFPVRVFISGGTVTGIDIGPTTIGITAGAVELGPGESITLAYSAAPTWTWLGL